MVARHDFTTDRDRRVNDFARTNDPCQLGQEQISVEVSSVLRAPRG